MFITENFAILNILRALEKLNKASGANGRADETPSPQAGAQENADDGQKPKTDNFAQSLLERHERSVNKIKNAGK